MLTTASGVHAPNMAQYAMTQLLAWAHRVPNWFHFKQTHAWTKNRWETFVLRNCAEKRWASWATAALGVNWPALPKLFRMQILVTKRDARSLQDSGYNEPGYGDPSGKSPDRIYPSEATRSMVAECDFVVITLPLTGRTHHLFDEEMFKAMRPTAFLVNVGRGAIIKEVDLIRALKRGGWAGAGLTCISKSRCQSLRSPLWEMDNVIMTPHVSGFTPQYDERATDIFAENLRRYLAGEPLLNQVSRTEGY